MDRDKFHLLFHDVLANIHDAAALEKLATNFLILLSEKGVSGGENLRHFVFEGIESLKPNDKSVNLETLGWRYYLILYNRYVVGKSIVDVQKHLSLGERQVRRLHMRSLKVLENILYNRFYPKKADIFPPPDHEEIEIGQANGSFAVLLEPLPLDRIVKEVTGLCLPRIHARGSDLELQIAPDLPMVQADRVILRQILLDLFNRVLQIWEHGNIIMALRPNSAAIVLEIQACVNRVSWMAEKEQAPEGPVQYWIERLNGRLSRDTEEESSPAHPGAVQVRYVLELPKMNRATILVVDDHEPAIRIIQRYLTQSNIQVVGITDPIQVFNLAKTTLPQAILLDVMMPSMDGWEILQKIKSDPETQQIAVIVCSVWNEPELAFSLGANGFLKKPINQAELVGELTRLNFWGISGE